MAQWKAWQNTHRRAVHGSGAIAWCMLFAFLVCSTASADTNTALFTPTNGNPQAITLTSRHVTFHWEPAETTSDILYELAAAYSASTDDTGKLSSPLALDIPNLLEPTVSGDVPGDGQLFWQVRAVRSDGSIASPWSQPWQLTIDTMPPTVTMHEYTNNPELPIIQGTVSEPDAVVAVFINGSLQGIATVEQLVNTDGQYTWSLLLQKALPYDIYTIQASAADISGNTTSVNKTIIINPPAVSNIPDVPNYSVSTLSVNGLAVPIKEQPPKTAIKISSSLDLQHAVLARQSAVQSAATMSNPADIIGTIAYQKRDTYLILLLAVGIFVTCGLGILYRLGEKTPKIQM
ncbi:MAG: hypothetical protein WBP26_05370 [Candidatus Saccharimonadales bacterium]